MSNLDADMKQQVMTDARDYRISAVLFRHVVAELLGVNITDMECLSLVYFNGLAKPSDISKYTGLSTGSTTAMLDRLEKSGLIKRTPNPNDRRSTLVVMTETGTENIEALFKPVRQAQKDLLERYSEDEMKLLSDFFKRSAAMWAEERTKLSGQAKEQAGA